MAKTTRQRRLWDAYRFAGFRPEPSVRGFFGDPQARILTLRRRSKKAICGQCGWVCMGLYDRRERQTRDLPNGQMRLYLRFEIRRIFCRRCGAVKRERLDFLADNRFYTKRFAYYLGRRCRGSAIKEIAEELLLRWDTVKELDKQYLQAQLDRAGRPGPKVIGTDEISIRKGHTYRIVVSDLLRQRPIWFGGEDRSEDSLDKFYVFLGE